MTTHILKMNNGASRVPPAPAQPDLRIPAPELVEWRRI